MAIGSGTIAAAHPIYLVDEMSEEVVACGMRLLRGEGVLISKV